MSESLKVKEELDFHYLLELMLPLHEEPQFAWLPELFSIIGYEKLLLLCKYAGGEKIKIPTISQLAEDIEVLQWFYDVEIAKKKSIADVPVSLHKLYSKVSEVYRVRDNSTSDRRASE